MDLGLNLGFGDNITSEIESLMKHFDFDQLHAVDWVADRVMNLAKNLSQKNYLMS